MTVGYTRKMAAPAGINSRFKNNRFFPPELRFWFNGGSRAGR